MIETLSNRDAKTFSKVTEWKKEISKIKDSKMKFDKDVVSVNIDQTKIDTLLKIQSDVEKADKERALYLTHKPVKELAVYSEPFSGK